MLSIRIVCQSNRHYLVEEIVSVSSRGTLTTKHLISIIHVTVSYHHNITCIHYINTNKGEYSC